MIPLVKLPAMRLATLLLFLTVTAAADDPIPRTGSFLNGRAWHDTLITRPGKVGYLLGFADGEYSMTCAKPPMLFGESTFGEIVDGLDDFYRDTANVLIPVPVAMKYFQMKVHGESPGKLAETLANWRRAAVSQQ